MEVTTAKRQTGDGGQTGRMGTGGSRPLRSRRVRRGERTELEAATAELLRRELSDSFSIMSGVRVWFRGRRLYLEHVVIGPTGVFLVAASEENPRRRSDLTRAVAFFMDMLGNYSDAFAVLAITGKGAETGPIPPVRTVESAVAAAAVIRQQAGANLSPEALREIRQRLETWYARGGRLPGGFTWREWVSLGSAAVLTTVMVADASEITVREWFPIFLTLELPLAGAVAREPDSDDVGANRFFLFDHDPGRDGDGVSKLGSLADLRGQKRRRFLNSRPVRYNGSES